MTIDLYRTLHVRQNASAKTIRHAYRKLAKAAHPDAPTGSTKTFAEIKLAHDVLTDPELRAHYDATGNVRDKIPDPGAGPAFAIIAGVIDHIVQQGIQQNIDIVYENLIEPMRVLIQKHLTKIMESLANAERKEQQYARIIGRFTDKSGEPSAVEMIIAGRLQGLRDEIRTHGIQKGFAEQALAIVSSHEFRAEQKIVVITPQAMYGVGAQTTTGSTMWSF